MISVLCVIVVTLAISYAVFNYYNVKAKTEGTKEMQEIAEAIRIGANAFIMHEYKILITISVLLALLLGIFISYSTGIAFAVGVVMSASAGWIGMKIATYSNVRVTNEARTTGRISKTVHVALKGASVMGLCVAAFAILGLIIVYALFNYQLEVLEMIENWAGFTFVPFIMTVSGYALGCSVVAMFDRVGGGIYTKAADMGADLVGKTEEDIPEDDPRNPATIADNVGDNVGDVAGLGSDLLESNVGAIVSAMLLGIYTFINVMINSGNVATGQLKMLCLYPVGIAALGLLSCIIGLFVVLNRPMSENPHKDLNKATFISATLTAILTAILTFFMFKNVDCTQFGFNLGAISAWVSALMGVVSGIAIGKISEYYTSYDYKPTKKIATASKEGAAITITEGIAVGMKSCLAPLFVLGVALLIAFLSAGMYGVAIAAVGMLSFVATTVSVDTYGPISDNSGGIAEMAHLDPKVRQITDKLDSVGNTTAAIGKGFAIGSAAFAALGLMVCYLYSYQPLGATLSLNLLNPLVLVGILIGGALPFYFSGMLIEAVSKAANGMVQEVRRQFREIVGLREGKAKPDYKRCIEISSSSAIKEMKSPALLAVFFPVISGFLFGPEFVAGILIGGIISAIMLAIFCGNAGGAWDNAKKFIEAGGVPGEGKGSEAHHASVVGDTVGDPLKDTDGPSLDILIKIMSTVSLITVCMFDRYNLLDFLINWLG
ncbi:MAG: sodium-translocating pyrophosphatase [Clostridia bacterium]|jgi:K(+)-stimulated pyrophosphate-energized sodium pump|nr:sodium-translocating pyrophosphatase [Clostridia bacterium]